MKFKIGDNCRPNFMSDEHSNKFIIHIKNAGMMKFKPKDRNDDSDYIMKEGYEFTINDLKIVHSCEADEFDGEHEIRK